MIENGWVPGHAIDSLKVPSSNMARILCAFLDLPEENLL